MLWRDIFIIFCFLLAICWLGTTLLFFYVTWRGDKDRVMGIFTFERLIEIGYLCYWFKHWFIGR